MATKRKPTSKSDEARRSLVQQAAAQVPWFHNCVLLDRLTDPNQREWYIRCTIEQGWGLSPRNLKYMRAFAAVWTDRSIVQEVLAQTVPHMPTTLHQRKAKAAKLDAAIAASLKELAYGR